MTYGVASGRGHSWMRSRRQCWRKLVRVLPDKRLKLASALVLKEAVVSCPGGHGTFVHYSCSGARVARSLSAIR